MSSIGDWSPSETLRVGQDPGGSRVLEALVNATATSKAKKKLLRKLKGMWAVLAVEPGGNHVVESCFIWGVHNYASPFPDLLYSMGLKAILLVLHRLSPSLPHFPSVLSFASGLLYLPHSACMRATSLVG